MKNSKISDTNTKLKTPLFYVGALVLLLAVLLILKTSEGIAEWWSRTIARGWIWFAGHVTGWFGFSLFEIACVVAIVAVIAIVVVIIVRLSKRKGKAALSLLLRTVAIALSVACIYTATAGFAYNRTELPLLVFEQNLTKEQAISAAEYYVDQLNALSNTLQRDENGVVVCPYDTKELSNKLREEYKRLDDEYNGYFNKYTCRGKSALSSYIMSQCWITGLFFSVTGEAHINTHCPVTEWAVTMAHEMAHSKGVMRENDANLTAYYITLTSQDAYIKYSGMYALLMDICVAVSYFPDSIADYKALVNQVDPKIIEERAYYNDFLLANNKMQEFEDWLNDIYLKLNGVEEGTESYIDRPQNIYDDTQVDGDNRPIATVISFSNSQKLIYYLLQQGQL